MLKSAVVNIYCVVSVGYNAVLFFRGMRKTHVQTIAGFVCLLDAVYRYLCINFANDVSKITALYRGWKEEVEG